MTDSQKYSIVALRREGMSYNGIAKKLEISVNTVKSFCRRRSLKSEEHVCKQCGVPVAQNPGRREKKFCSDACRMKWWSAHPEESRNASRIVCPVCGKIFVTHSHSKRKYCSHKCYIKDRFGGDQYEQG